MKLKFALVGLVALGGAALTAGTASAMPVAPLSPNRKRRERCAGLRPERLHPHRAACLRLWLRRPPAAMATACGVAAMPTDIAGAIAAGDQERGLRPSFSFAGEHGVISPRARVRPSRAMPGECSDRSRSTQGHLGAGWAGCRTWPVPFHVWLADDHRGRSGRLATTPRRRLHPRVQSPTEGG